MGKTAEQWARRPSNGQEEASDRSFQQRLKLEVDSQNALELAVIIQHLQEHPEKIKGCKSAVLGTMFCLRDAGTEFSHTNKWLFKIPKDHIKPLILKLRPSLGEHGYNLANKADKQSPYRILYRLTGWAPGTHNTLFIKDEFDEAVVQQASLVKAPEEIPMTEEGEILWDEFGIYRCLPPCPDGQDKSAWAYKEVEAFGRFKVPSNRKEGRNNLGQDWPLNLWDSSHCSCPAHWACLPIPFLVSGHKPTVRAVAITGIPKVKGPILPKVVPFFLPLASFSGALPWRGLRATDMGSPSQLLAARGYHQAGQRLGASEGWPETPCMDRCAHLVLLVQRAHRVPGVCEEYSAEVLRPTPSTSGSGTGA